jgi:glutamyl-tRNA reductase
MPIYLYGMNHVSAPLPIREKAALPHDTLVPAVRRLLSFDGMDEGLILSTCNRTELLVNARASEAPMSLKRFLARERGMDEDQLERHCYLHCESEAVRHVFRVASSLDSMVIGESQILGQVKEAYAAAVEAGGLKTALDALMQRSFSVAKKVRTETGIARSPVSIAHAAAGLARDIFGDLRKSAILILGAGKMGRLAAQHLMRDGVRSAAVVNRSFQRAAVLAAELGGRAVPYDRLFEEMEQADVVVASTSAPHHVVRYEDAVRVSRARRGRPLFFIDIAVPRDIDPRVNDIDNVYVYDIDELKGVVDANRNERQKEADLAEAIVDRETTKYLSWLRTLQVAPTIVDLRRQIHGLGMDELERFRSRLAALDPQQQKTLEEFTISLINKILHHPTQALKHAAARSGAVGPLEFVREIFGLDARPPASVAPGGDTSGEAAGASPEAVPALSVETDPETPAGASRRGEA